MKTHVATAIVLVSLFAAPYSHAQNKLELFANVERTECEVSDNSGPAVVAVHAWVTGPIQGNVARFKAPKPACWQGATWVGDTLPVTSVAIGNSQIDWTVAFFTGTGHCVPEHIPPIYVGAINFFVTGEALPCCEMVAMPFSPGFVDCSFNELPLTAGQKVVINPDDTCRCQSPLAIEATTWGRVKSFYR